MGKARGGKAVEHDFNIPQPFEPFLELNNPMECCEWFKLFLFFPIAVVRFTIIVVVLLLWAVLVGLATCGAGDKPFTRGRRQFISCVSVPTACIVLLCLGFFCTRYRGTLHIMEAKELRAVVIHNYQSWVDILLLVYCFGSCVFVCKDFVRTTPLLGCVARAFEPIWVSRDKGTGLSAQIRERVLRDDFPLVLMSPEGLTSKGDTLLKFKRGAFVSGQPVLPVLIKYDWEAFNPAWTLTSKGFHLLRMLTQVYNSVSVQIRPPHIPNDAELSDVQLYCDRVRKLMATHMAVEMADAGFPECRALLKAGCCVPFHGHGLAGSIPDLPAADGAMVAVAHTVPEELQSEELQEAAGLDERQTIAPDGFTAEHFDELQKLFDRYDVNCSNTISQEELSQLMLNTCYVFGKKGMKHIPIQEVDERLASVASDIDWNYQEWLGWLQEAFPEIQTFSRSVVAAEF